MLIIYLINLTERDDP